MCKSCFMKIKIVQINVLFFLLELECIIIIRVFEDNIPNKIFIILMTTILT